MNPRIVDNIDYLFFDFDGVFTNNKVSVDEYGKETVVCSRADSLGLSLLKKFCFKYKKDIETAVISTEKNPVVSQRCKKIGIKTLQGVEDKLKLVKSLVNSTNLKRTCFVGNDLNDYEVILQTGFSYCPNDAHNLIKKISKYTLPLNGGEGFVRAVIEHLLDPFDIELILKDKSA